MYAAMLLALALSQGIPPQKGAAADTSPRNALQPAAFSPANPEIRPDPSPQDRQTERQTEATESQADAAWWAVIVAWGALFVALAQGGLFFWQLQLMLKSIDDTKDTALAAIKAAKAAEDAVEVARQTAERELRAYMAVRPRFTSANENNLFVIRCWCDLSNKGRTPAYHVRSIQLAGVGDAGTMHSTDIDYSQAPIFGMVTPDTGVPALAIPYQLQFAQVDLLRASPAKRLYYYGVVAYEDAFHKDWIQYFQFYVDWGIDNSNLNIVFDESGNDELRGPKQLAAEEEVAAKATK